MGISGGSSGIWGEGGGEALVTHPEAGVDPPAGQGDSGDTA